MSYVFMGLGLIFSIILKLQNISADKQYIALIMFMLGIIIYLYADMQLIHLSLRKINLRLFPEEMKEKRDDDNENTIESKINRAK